MLSTILSEKRRSENGQTSRETDHHRPVVLVVERDALCEEIQLLFVLFVALFVLLLADFDTFLVFFVGELETHKNNYEPCQEAGIGEIKTMGG